jgi:hypothetical protein
MHAAESLLGHAAIGDIALAALHAHLLAGVVDLQNDVR